MIVFNIKNLRKSKKISARKLSRLTGISRSYILELENNKKTNPSLKTLEKIANALNLNVKDLFYTEFELEVLKKKLDKYIDIYGIDSKEVLELSQFIDLLINIEIKGAL